jgi:hypothetical protein
VSLQEQLYQQLLKAKEGEVEANKRRADDLMKLALAFAQGKGKREQRGCMCQQRQQQ